MSSPTKSARLLSRREVIDRVGVSYPTLWSWMRAGKFPRSRVIGGKIAWLDFEIERWIMDLPIKPLKGDDAEAAP
jgi:predicted DNA-binding transcriptional regulator AlpA